MMISEIEVHFVFSFLPLSLSSFASPDCAAEYSIVVSRDGMQRRRAKRPLPRARVCPGFSITLCDEGEKVSFFFSLSFSSQLNCGRTFSSS